MSCHHNNYCREYKGKCKCKKDQAVVDMGFRKSVRLASDTHSKNKVSVWLISIDGVETLFVTSNDPRQYIEVPMSLVDKAVEDVTGQELQAAASRRAKANGWS